MKNKSVLTFIGTWLIAAFLIGCGPVTEVIDSTEKTETTVSAQVNISDASATITLDGSNISVAGEGCENKDGVVYITSQGTYAVTGNGTDCAILVDTDDDVNIILNNVTISNSQGPVIYGNNSKSITIYLADGSVNELTDGSSYETDSDGNSVGKGVISSNDDLIFAGSGKLIINGNYKHGISGDDSITFEGGEYEITASTDGIHANDLITINGGVFSIDAASDLMGCDGDLIVNDGTISGASDDEGLEGKGSVYINGGSIDISVEDDGINAGSYIEINGGSTYITCQSGDAIDCNGCTDGAIVINDGFVYAKGGNAPEGAIDNDNGSVYINGGTVIAIGAVNSPIDTNNSKQTTVVYGSFNSNEALGILDSEGKTLFAINPVVSGSTMIISVPGMDEGNNYFVYTGGNISGDADTYGYYSNGSYSGGTEAYSFTVESVVVEAGGSDAGMTGGGGGFGGGRPNGDFNGENATDGSTPPDFNNGENGDRPEMPENFNPDENGQRPEMPNNMNRGQKDSGNNTNNQSL